MSQSSLFSGSRVAIAALALCTSQFAHAVTIPGWTVIDTITVATNGGSTSSSVTLADGQAYKVAASGTFNIGGFLADAEYIWNGFVPGTHNYCVFGGVAVCDYGIAINDTTVGGFKGTDWGVFNANRHEYIIDYTGAGQQLGFSFHDDNYRDNFDTLKVEIFSQVNAPVPEPGTWALMVGGLSLVSAFARRKRAIQR